MIRAAPLSSVSQDTTIGRCIFILPIVFFILKFGEGIINVKILRHVMIILYSLLSYFHSLAQILCGRFSLQVLTTGPRSFPVLWSVPPTPGRSQAEFSGFDQGDKLVVHPIWSAWSGPCCWSHLVAIPRCSIGTKPRTFRLHRQRSRTSVCIGNPF